LRHLAQHFDTVQLAFAHDHQSHSHTPILVQTGKCDISTLQMWDIIALRLHKNTHNYYYVNKLELYPHSMRLRKVQSLVHKTKKCTQPPY
jgi:hypothetical protein